jgi:hypothetical protein
MVQVDLPAAFAIGHIFAILSKDYLKQEPQLFTHRLLGPFNLFLVCGFVPGGLFLLVGWPAWEVMYWTDWVEAPFDRPWVAAFYVFFAIVMVVLGNVGYMLAHAWLRQGREKQVRLVSTFAVFLTILPFLLQWGVWTRVGSYAQVVEIKAGYYDWMQPPFFHGWLAIMLYMTVAIVLMGLWMKKRGNALKP